MPSSDTPPQPGPPPRFPPQHPDESHVVHAIKVALWAAVLPCPVRSAEVVETVGDVAVTEAVTADQIAVRAAGDYQGQPLVVAGGAGY